MNEHQTVRRWLRTLCIALPVVAPAAAQEATTRAVGAAPIPAEAAPPRASPSDEIVVEGKPRLPSRGEAAEQARQLSGASRKYDENLARFQVPLCPGVVGFKREPAEMIVDRIRFNAVRLGIALAKGRCSPNLVVAVVADGKALISRLEKQRPAVLGFTSVAEREALLGDNKPVRVWNNIVTLDASGAPVPRARDGTEMLPSVWGYTNRWFVKFHRDILASIVVFDQQAVIGMTLVQLADYATIRGAARMRPATGGEPMPTLLALFAEGGRRASELTSFDIGYLRSLYWERPDEPAASKLLRVRREAEKAREETLKAASGFGADVPQWAPNSASQPPRVHETGERQVTALQCPACEQEP